MDKALKVIDLIQRPIFIAQGEYFEYNDELNRFRNYLNDFFYKRSFDKIVNIKQILTLLLELLPQVKLNSLSTFTDH